MTQILRSRNKWHNYESPCDYDNDTLVLLSMMILGYRGYTKNNISQHAGSVNKFALSLRETFLKVNLHNTTFKNYIGNLTIRFCIALFNNFEN